MTPLHVFRWLMAAAVAALLSATTQPAAANRMGGVHGGMGGRGGGGPHHSMGGFGGGGPHHSMGGFGGGGLHHSMAGSVRDGPHVSMGQRFGHGRFFDNRFVDHRSVNNRFVNNRFFDNRFFDNDGFFFRHHNNFVFVFDFVSFGFPVGFPVVPVGFTGWYPGYADDSSYSGNGPVYDRQYWADLAMSVQSELAQRGYYHGPIDGDIGSGSSQAIRAFQAAQGLPVTGKIDPKLLNALGIKYKTA
jgi:Putative peptidoglycan binding domain